MVKQRTTPRFLSAGAGLLALCMLAFAVRAQDPPANGADANRRARRAASLRPRVAVQALPGGRAYRLHTFRVSLARAKLEVVDLRMSRALDEVLRTHGASLVINGGFFGMRGQPEGMVVSGGRLVSPFMSRIGGGVVAAREGVAELFDGAVQPSVQDVDFAMQCRPRLVVDGAVNIRSDDGKRADRTALCLRDGGRTLDVIVARTQDPSGRDGPTLYRFARVLARRGCEQALNLDGGPSTGVAWRDGEHVRFLPPRSAVRHAVVVRLNERP